MDFEIIRGRSLFKYTASDETLADLISILSIYNILIFQDIFNICDEISQYRKQDK